jgi:hypothetical protein
VAWPTTQYRGLDVLDLDPNAAQPNDTSYHRSTQRFDPGPGAVTVIDRSGVTTLDAKAIPFLLASRDEITDFQTWLTRRRGRLVPFWAPTWQADLVLHTQANAGSTGFVIFNTGYTRFQFASIARRDLAIFMLDHSGIYFHRVIASVEELDGTEALSIESSHVLEATLTPSNCIISFLPFCRLASDDTPEFKWQTTTVLEAVMQIASLPGETPA